MINYIIINGTNSNTINGLGINELPPISKPPLRVQTEEIDGRDGDISTNLGYGAYDKTISIGLFGTGYDINDVISFFNGEGTVVFSNEPDKYYKYKIINQIDYEALLKFKSATITFHCQPFKYPLEETPLEIEYEYIEQEGVESATMNNTNGGTSLKIDLKGNTSQYSTTGKNLANSQGLTTQTINGITFTPKYDDRGLLEYVNVNGTASALTNYAFANNDDYSANTYKMQKCNRNGGSTLMLVSSGGSVVISLATSDSVDFTISATTTAKLWIRVYSGETINNEKVYPMVKLASNTDDTYEPYTNGASPNPDYPQPINVVSGDNTIKVGQNIWNYDGTGYEQGYYDASGNFVSRNDYRCFTYDCKQGDLFERTGDGFAGVVTFWDNTTFVSSSNFDLVTPKGIVQVPQNANKIKIAGTNASSSSWIRQNLVSYPINLGVENLIDTLATTPKSNGATYSQDLKSVVVDFTTSNDEYFGIISGIENPTTKAYTISFDVSGVKSGEAPRYNLWGSGEQYTLVNGRNVVSIPIGTTIPSGVIKFDDQARGTYTNTSTITFSNFQLEYGEKANSYTPYGQTPIELCKIGDYQDYFTKNSDGQWCKYNAIGKVVLSLLDTWYKQADGNFYVMNFAQNKGYISGYGLSNIFTYSTTSWVNNCFGVSSTGALWVATGDTTITTQNELITFLENKNAIMYGVLATPYLSLIEDETLINQLDNIQNAMSYEGTTNIGQVNNDKPFLLDLIAMEKGTDEVVINNIGNVYAKPTIALEGTGETDIYLNNTEILKVDLSEKNKITIDTNNMEAYDPTDNSLANRKVIGNYNSMTLPSGNTTMKITGALTKATITDYSRWL